MSEAFLSWLLKAICKELKPLKKHQKSLRRHVGVVIVDAKEMGVLNKKYRNKIGATDVLSFSGEENFLGDIVVCASKVRSQARTHKLHPSEEFAYLVLHGLLHLLGYDHEVNAAQAKKMFHLQDNLFAVLMDQDILKVFKRLS